MKIPLKSSSFAEFPLLTTLPRVRPHPHRSGLWQRGIAILYRRWHATAGYRHFARSRAMHDAPKGAEMSHLTELKKYEPNHIILYIYNLNQMLNMPGTGPEIKSFIRAKSSLFWHIPEDKKEDISQELLVETILNYGNMEDVKKLFTLLGIDKVAEIFFSSINMSDRRRGNFHELTINYFTHLFKRHAHGDS